jgi:SAM-dependent MidA family methyltransferase
MAASPPRPEAERFDRFMARANAAYYATHDPFRDFATAPELTQVFGELLGGWARVVADMLGTPHGLMLVEAGPGRGVLMADALRAFGRAEVHFIEQSSRLRAEQARRVPGATWHATLDTVPLRPMILLANEFLDALPVRQFIRRPAGWMERWVADGCYEERPAERALPDHPEGTVLEIGEAATDFVAALAQRRAAALLIDYGPMRSAPGESVQAIRDGRPSDPLLAAGTADLSAHVDFAALAAAARAAGAEAHGPVKQNAFLTALGLHQRTALLAARSADAGARLRLAARRLTAPEAMGSLFKVLAICPKGLTPPGFESP